MTFDLVKIMQSKCAYRQRLADQPIAEKLALLDALRERTLAIRSARPDVTRGRVAEKGGTTPVAT